MPVAFVVVVLSLSFFLAKGCSSLVVTGYNKNNLDDYR